MIIPNKHSGYQAGIRLYRGGGGGGAPAEVSAPSTPAAPPVNTAGTSTIPRDNLNLRNMAGMRYDQAGPQYNALLQQGYAGSDIRNALTTQGRPVSDSDYGLLIQNAGMTSPTSRPFAGSDQFYQPVYNSSYMNYARPATQFDVSTYGTQPVYSPARAWNDRNSGSAAGGQQVVNNAISNYFQQNPNSDINSTLAAMRGSGINRTDIQSWGGVNNYGPQMSMPQMQSPFNPYSNSSGYGGFGGFGGMGGGLGSVSPANNMAPIDQHGLDMIASARASSSYANSGGPFGMGGYGQQMQSPFSYQQPQQYNPYQQYEQSLGSYNPYQMQSPFSYQQPMPQRTSSGPSQAIVGRSSQMRGTPNVMRRAEGGITSLMDDVE